jgi:two-component system nitrogen regulation response regulator GlnG
MLTDVMLTDGDGIEPAPVRAAFPRMQVIILSAQNTLDTAVRASDTGAFEYFPKPFDLEELVRTVRQALGSARRRTSPGRRRAGAGPAAGRAQSGDAGGLPHDHARVAQRSDRADPGRTGTGKELVAEAIHQLGSRREGRSWRSTPPPSRTS